jgi:hypothetical protein
LSFANEKTSGIAAMHKSTQQQESLKCKQRFIEGIERKKQEQRDMVVSERRKRRFAQKQAKNNRFLECRREIATLCDKYVVKMIDICKATLLDHSVWKRSLFSNTYSVTRTIDLDAPQLRQHREGKMNMKRIVKLIRHKFQQQIADDSLLDVNGNNINNFNIRIAKKFYLYIYKTQSYYEYPYQFRGKHALSITISI